MTKEQEKQIRADKEWIKISYRGSSCSGEMILKRSMYELKKKKIDKLLKGLEITVQQGYTLTLSEYLELDNRYVNQFRLVSALKLNMNRYIRTYEDFEDYEARIYNEEKILKQIKEDLEENYKKEFRL